MICRAKGCHNEKMPDSDLCGLHDELREDGERIIYRRTVVSQLTDQEKAERWEATRKRQREHKRIGHPEWREITRRDGARTIEEMARMYDERRRREKERREKSLVTACRETQKAAARNAAQEVLEEIKRKRLERGSKLGRTA